MDMALYTNSIFEQPWWLDIVAPGSWKEIIIKDERECIIARMPYVINGNRVFMPEKTQTLGIWISSDIKDDYEKIKEIVYSITDNLSNYKTISHNLSPSFSYVLPFHWKGYSIETAFTYRILDLSNLDAIYKKFGKSTKKNIKYAQNRVKIISNKNFEHMWDLLQKTYKIQGRDYKVPREISEKLFYESIGNGHGIYLEAIDELGNIHSCGFFVYDENVFYYLTGARDPEFSKSQSQILLIWKAIQIASQKSKIFDFEGSMVEDIEKFFRKFGGECISYYIIKKQSMFSMIIDDMKPYLKKLIGYKI